MIAQEVYGGSAWRGRCERRAAVEVRGFSVEEFEDVELPSAVQRTYEHERKSMLSSLRLA